MAVAATAAVTLATAALAPSAWAQGPDSSLCKMNTSRGQIPANFTVDACFDGKILTLRNRTSITLRVYGHGDIQNGVRNADSPTLAAALTTISSDANVIPPGSYLQLWLGPGATDIEMEIALDANRRYALTELLASYIPGPVGAVVGVWTDVANAQEAILAEVAAYKQCDAAATNWLGSIECTAAMANSVSRTANELILELGLDVGKLGLLTGALISTIRYLFFDSQQQARDLSVIANSQPSLHIAAISGTASNGSGSPSAKAPNTTGSAQPLPAEPTGASASMGSTSAGLTWTDNSNNEAGFVTQYRPAGGSTWIAGPSVGANVTSAIVTGLNSGTSYTFQVGARNSAGTHWSAYFYGTTPAQPSSPPPPPPPPPPLPPASPGPYHAGRQVAIASQATGGDSGHTGPSNSYAAGPTHPANSPLWIVCHVNGQSITGPYDTTAMWDLATDGYYYTDAWLYTGTNGPAVPLCALKTVTVDAHATGGDSGHTGPSDSYAAGPTRPANSPVTIVCRVNGQSITGPYDTTAMWDLATDGYYYTDAWLYTGTNGPAVPPC